MKMSVSVPAGREVSLRREKKKTQNSPFFRYILLPNTEYKITRRKKEKDVSVK